MPQKKTIFIIPGFRQLSTSKTYKTLAKTLKKEGYFPILVAIPWKNSTLSQNITYFMNEYKKIRRKKKYILGFSYGAMIAFIAATKVTASGLILCSLSPYFKEDVLEIKRKTTSPLMIKRYKDFLQFHCQTLVKQLKTQQILMLYGKKEAFLLIRRVKEAFKYMPSAHKQLLPIKNTDHNIGNKRYLNQIHKAVHILL